jgi:two-component system NtrC family response regulator
MKRVLVIEDDEDIRDNLVDLLDAEGYTPIGAANGSSGLAEAMRQPPDLVLCDIAMPIMDGRQVLEGLRAHPPTAQVPFVFLTAMAQRDDRRRGMALGADDYLTKPFARAELLEVVRTRLARTSVAPPKGGSPSPSPMRPIVRSPALLETFERARLAAQSRLTILLLGETGVGKDVLARVIHQASPRADGPFVPVHCMALSPALVESELFGHERGAFTGADAPRTGLFELADGGTLFLDEIGELSHDLQVKLLRVLEDKHIRRVGSNISKPIDVRIVAATNQDLLQKIQARTFRQDLYYRLAGFVLHVPPLRQRLEEISPLGISRRTLLNRLDTYGLPRPRKDRGV